MKTTLDLPDELMREMKLRAVIQRRTLRDLVAEFLRQGLGLASPSQSDPAQAARSDAVVTQGDSGLPMIRCRTDAPATQMSLQDLLAIEQQTLASEDLRRVKPSV